MRPSIQLLTACIFSITLETFCVNGASEILFVGNSFTNGQYNVSNNGVQNFNKANVTDLYNKVGLQQASGYGGVGGVFKSLDTSANNLYNVSISCKGSTALLADHYNGTVNLPGLDPSGTYTTDERLLILRKPTWNTVVLQDGASTPLDSYSNFIDGVTYCTAAIRNATYGNPSARIVLYETWAYPNHVSSYASLLQMQTDLKNAYAAAAIAVGSNVVIAPVGDAFMNAIALGGAGNNPYNHAGASNPFITATAGQINLWSDQTHASTKGYYLASLVIYETVTGYDSTLFSANYSGGTAEALGISQQDAEYLNWVAHYTCAIPEPSTYLFILTGVLIVFIKTSIRRKSALPLFR